ncbi:hypothetical protein LG299_05175 [Microbacterium lacus]
MERLEPNAEATQLFLVGYLEAEPRDGESPNVMKCEWGAVVREQQSRADPIDRNDGLGRPKVVGVLDEFCQPLQTIIAQEGGTVASPLQRRADRAGETLQTLDESQNASVGRSLIEGDKGDLSPKLGDVVGNKVRDLACLLGAEAVLYWISRHNASSRDRQSLG